MRCINLDVWKIACRLCVDVYKEFRDLKDFGFKDQITRSALSVASNIAEGVEKDSKKEIMRFLGYSQSSCAELTTQIFIAIEIGYLDKKKGFEWIDKLDKILKMFENFKKTLR